MVMGTVSLGMPRIDRSRWGSLSPYSGSDTTCRVCELRVTASVNSM